MADRPTPASIDAYAADLPEVAQERLRRVRALVRAEVPEAEETISYRMPAFTLGGRTFLYVAAFQKHLGVYPLPADAGALEAALAPYRAGKATLQVPWSAPLPEELLRAVIRLKADLARARGPRSGRTRRPGA